jgi:hypothetical protein
MELQLDHVKLGLILFRRFSATSFQVSLSGAVSLLRLPGIPRRELTYRDPFITLEAHGHLFLGSSMLEFFRRVSSLGIETKNG